MPECTHQDLRKAREAAGLTQWQAAGELGASESTIKRWESGETKPTPEDVWRMEKLYNCRGLWHRWMRSNHDSYREHYPEEAPNLALPVAVLNARHQLADVLAMQDLIERDALDGRLDDEAGKRKYVQEIHEAQASLTEVLTQLERR